MDPTQEARERMVAEQLAARGIHDQRVLDALARVPREKFVATEERQAAYTDHAMPIDCGQTISQPYIVALMTQALELSGTQRVLEIGTGSGYQTAILAELAAEVISVERFAELSAQAGRALAAEGYTNVQLEVGDGSLGWPPGAPYDRILVTAAAEEVPPALAEQLADSGRLVLPVGPRDQQVLCSIHRTGDRLERTELTGCRFVPLVGDQGWPD